MKERIALILICLPIYASAEGQEVFVFIADSINFIKVFGIWFVLLLAITLSLKKWSRYDLTKSKRRILWGTTGLAALFIWSMVKYDPYPYNGPIDSIFKKELTYDPTMFEADSSIEYVIESINKNEEGAYIWLNSKKYFVRKLTVSEKNQNGFDDSLTMEIVRNWKKQ